MPQKVKKPVTILVIFMLITEKKTKRKYKLENMPCIWYLITFKDEIDALFDSRNEIKAISQAFAFKLDFKI